jgi:uncharacterized membrane protein
LFQARDADIGINAQIEYIMSKNNAIDLPFYIAPTTGELYTTRALANYNNNDGQFTFEVIARNKDVKENVEDDPRATVIVNISIQDVNILLKYKRVESIAEYPVH